MGSMGSTRAGGRFSRHYSHTLLARIAAALEAAPAGLTVPALEAALPLSRQSITLYLHELAARQLAHHQAQPDPRTGAHNRWNTAHRWFAGPAPEAAPDATPRDPWAMPAGFFGPAAARAPTHAQRGTP